MSAILPINLDDLLHCRGVESERVEFKASWDATTGPQVLRTIAAFANDFHNLNGGYVVIGVGERRGRAVLPPRGLSAAALDTAQKWLRGNCNRLDPPYPPVLAPETVEGKLVLVVWAPASDMRPHRAPAAPDGPGRYWVRLGAETVDAARRGDLLRRLFEQTARVPWDDRAARTATVEDLRSAGVREFLRDVKSGLLAEVDEREVYRRMRLTTRLNNHEVPRNVALLLFGLDPRAWSRGASIELVQFTADRAGDVQIERTFAGGLIDQIRACLRLLQGLVVSSTTRKRKDAPRADRWASYPMLALREVLVNAVYHRGYDLDQPEPTKVYVYPGRIEIVSYPGPVPGVEAEHLRAGAAFRAVPARNRRLGEFLKEVGLAEGRLSGLPRIYRAMADNGSPPPAFAFDEHRTYFQATLPAHPESAPSGTLR